jgi:hypothetical protein
MPNPTCSTCRAFNALTRECRREAPKVLAVPNKTTMSMDVHGVFPGTPETGWCMQHTELTMVFHSAGVSDAETSPAPVKLEIVPK